MAIWLTRDSSFINNEWVEGADKKKFDVVNPATEDVITSVCEATEKDVDIAVAAARKAFETTWRQVTPQARGVMLLKLADLVEKNADLLAAVESLDNGKSITMARGDLGAVVGTLRYYGGWADKITGKTLDVAPNMFHYIRREPVSLPSLRLPCVGAYPCTPRLASAARSSHGTFHCSCLPGKSAPPSPRATRLS